MHVKYNSRSLKRITFIQMMWLAFFIMINQLASAQVSITGAGTITESFTGFAGAATPTNWTVQGTGSGGTTWRGTTQTTGTSGGWYGNNNMSFLGSGSASNGNGTWLLQNNSGSTITGFTISFTAQLWKTGSASPSVTAYWSNSASSTNPAQGALANSLSSLSFNDATTNINTGAILSQTVSSLSIANGQYIFIRFIHAGGSSSDNMGWDEINFTPTLAGVVAPTVTTDAINSILQTSAAGGGNVTNDGGASVTARGICWNTLTAPTLSNSFTTDGSGLGTFTSSLGSLTPGTPYFVRAYATNSAGTSYGNEVTFTTLKNSPTSQATNISFSATAYNKTTASWTNGDGDNRIVIVNTVNSFTNPSNGTDPAANSVYSGSGEQVVYNGSGSSVTVTGLTGSSQYFFRVYEFNNSGANTLYITSTASGNPNSVTTTVPPCLAEDFTNIGFPYTGWLATGVSRVTGTNQFNTSPAGIEYTGNSGTVTLPAQNLPQTLNFYLYRTTNTTAKTLNINVSTTSPTSGYTTIASFNNGSIPSATWTLMTVDLSAYSSNVGVYIQLEKVGTNTSPWRMDDFEIYCAPCVSPTINSSPSNASICDPGNATFTVSATGTLLTYQWQVSTDNGGTWNNLSDAGIYSGSSTNSLSLTGATLTENSYQYQCVVTGFCGTATSSPGILTVNTIPATPGAISGISYVCPPFPVQSTFSISPVAGATSYSWTFDPGSNGATYIGPTNGTSAVVEFNTTTNSTYKLRVTASNGCGTSAESGTSVRRSLSVPQLNGSAFVCAGSSDVYSVPVAVVGAVSYTFTGPAGSTIDGNPSPYTTTNLSVTVAFPIGFTSGSVCVTANDPCGTPTAQRCVSVGTIPARPANVVGPATVCPNSTGIPYSVVAVAGATSYLWTVPSGATIATGAGTNSITVDFSNSFAGGSICAASANACGNSVYKCSFISSGSPAQPSVIGGQFSGVCGASSVAYNVTNNAAVSTYNWTLPTGATIVSGAGTNSITVDFSSATLPGQICVTGTNACGSSPSRCASVSAVPARPGNIVGPSLNCINTTNINYSVPSVFGATSYSWTFPSGVTIVSGSGTNSITVNWGNTGGNINVKANSSCGQGLARTLAVTVDSIPATPGAITGTSFVCVPQNGVTYSIAPVPGALSYSWFFDVTSTGATFVGPTDGTSVVVNFGTTTNSTYKLRVVAINDCGTSLYSGFLVRKSISTPQITGPTVACPNTTLTYSVPNAVVGASSYTWTAPTGATIDGNPSPFTTTNLSVNVAFPNGFTGGSVCVYATDPCNVNTAQRCLTIQSLPARPSNITGSAAVCAGSTGLTYTVTPVSGATGYTWTVPGTASIVSGQGTGTITVDYSLGFVGGSICVTADNACGSSASYCKVIGTALPGRPGNISGPANGVCNSSQTYSITALGNATSYSWTVPTGASITSGNGTTSITVDFNGATLPGNICVSAVNACGTGPSRCLQINSIPQQPSLITGPTAVCANQTGVTYSVTNDPLTTSYVWSVPFGASITSGAGTNAITVTYGSNGGNVTVKALNACGQSGTRVMPVIVNCRISSGLFDAGLSVYPNPVDANLNIDFNMESSEKTTIQMVDLSGRVIMENTVTATEGYNHYTMDVSKIARGNYMIIVRGTLVNERIKIQVQ